MKHNLTGLGGGRGEAMAARGVKLEGEGAARALNRLAREQMKHRILADIRMDMLTCELEGWDKLEYLNELIDMISHFQKQIRNRRK